MPDIILVRMVADPSKPVEQRVHYRNAIQGLYSMISHEGLSSVFRGLLPNTVRAVIMNSSQLVSYDYFKTGLLSYGMQDGLGAHILSSALAGTVATTFSAPADVVKSRIMNMRKGSGGQGIVSMIGSALKSEGPMFLFKGWLPAWSKFLPPLLPLSVQCTHRSPPYPQHYPHLCLPRTTPSYHRSLPHGNRTDQYHRQALII